MPYGTSQVTLTREMLPALTAPARSKLVERGDLTIGYLTFVRFVPGASQHVRAELERLLARNVDALVLDLRNNGGGAVSELIAIADLFLAKDALLASLAGRIDTLELRAPGPALTELPLAVLVNRGTASAAEGLSGALQAHGRGERIPSVECTPP